MTKRRRLLLVCDRPDSVVRYEAWFDDLDYEIQLAEDASTTIALNQRFDPNLVILDATFADRDGFDLCRQLKNDSNGIQPAIMIVSGLNELDDIEHAVVVGTDDFMSSPLNYHEFIKRLKNLLEIDAVRRDSQL